MAVSVSSFLFLSTRPRHQRERIHWLHTKALFRQSIHARTTNPKYYLTRLFFQTNHSSLESQVELTGMLSSREQNPFPIPPFKMNETDQYISEKGAD